MVANRVIKCSSRHATTHDPRYFTFFSCIKSNKHYHSRPADLGGPPAEMPEPIIVDGEDLYEVEAVLAERTLKNKRQGENLLHILWGVECPTNVLGE